MVDRETQMANSNRMTNELGHDKWIMNNLQDKRESKLRSPVG